MINISEVLAQQIADNLGSGWVWGVNVFSGPEQEPRTGSIPHEAVFVVGTGGVAPKPSKDGTQMAYTTAQITIRSNPKAWDDGLALANSVIAALNYKPPSTMVEINIRSSRPSPFPPTDQGSHRWILNADCLIQETQ